MPVDLRASFDAFDEAVSLPQSAIRRIESAWEALAAFLTSKLRLAEDDLFLQGSYPNNTAVRPVDGGEYDVDVVVRMAGSSDTADAALDALEALLLSDGRYRDRVKPKTPCVRLEYAEDGIGKFHVDVVPVRASGRALPPLDAPRRGDGWHGTAPREYTLWCAIQGPRFARTVKALKRWRDEQQSVRHAIKSITLQALVARYMPDEPDDALRLVGTIEAMHQALSGLTQPPVVPNPVLPVEDLAARWPEASFKEFVVELHEARTYARAAVTTSDRVEAVEAWRQILGSAFPGETGNDLGIRLGDDHHARTFAFEGWTERLDPMYGVHVQACTQRGRRQPRLTPYESDTDLLFHGTKLRFRAVPRGPADAEMWWQVANTGLAARGQGGLRGEFFKARKLNGAPSDNPRETWENTSYTGAHWIRALLVKDGRVVAVSEKFVVKIYNKGQRFGL
jgi:hypothetical protein